jgi:hypothetical protein
MALEEPLWFGMQQSAIGALRLDSPLLQAAMIGDPGCSVKAHPVLFRPGERDSPEIAIEMG